MDADNSDEGDEDDRQGVVAENSDMRMDLTDDLLLKVCIEFHGLLWIAKELFASGQDAIYYILFCWTVCFRVLSMW